MFLNFLVVQRALLSSQRVVCLKYVVVTRNKQAYNKQACDFLGWIVFF